MRAIVAERTMPIRQRHGSRPLYPALPPMFQNIGDKLCKKNNPLEKMTEGSNAEVFKCKDTTEVWRLVIPRINLQRTNFYNNDEEKEDYDEDYESFINEIHGALQQYILSLDDDVNFVLPVHQIARRRDGRQKNYLESGFSEEILKITDNEQQAEWDIVDIHELWVDRELHQDTYTKKWEELFKHGIAFQFPQMKQTLAEYIKHIEPEKIIPSLVLRLVEMLRWLHLQDVAHCDLKADNLMMQDTIDTLQFIDFGSSLDMFNVVVEGQQDDEKKRVEIHKFQAKDCRQLGLLLLHVCGITLIQRDKKDTEFYRLVDCIQYSRDLCTDSFHTICTPRVQRRGPQKRSGKPLLKQKVNEMKTQIGITKKATPVRNKCVYIAIDLICEGELPSDQHIKEFQALSK